MDENIDGINFTPELQKESLMAFRDGRNASVGDWMREQLGIN